MALGPFTDVSAMDILDTFESSGPHFRDRSWPTDNYCVLLCALDDKPRSFTFAGNDKEHGAEQAVHFLVQHAKDLKPQKICFYLNWSPCAHCSSVLINFNKSSVQRKMSLIFEIIFRGLFEITRPSCKGKSCDCATRRPEHVRRLHTLWKSENVTVRTFVDDDWKMLMQLLHDNERTKDEDELLSKDFAQLMAEQDSKKNEVVVNQKLSNGSK